MFSLAFEQVHAEMSTKEMQNLGQLKQTKVINPFKKSLKNWLGSVISIVVPQAAFCYKLLRACKGQISKSKKSL